MARAFNYLSPRPCTANDSHYENINQLSIHLDETIVKQRSASASVVARHRHPRLGCCRLGVRCVLCRLLHQVCIILHSLSAPTTAFVGLEHGWRYRGNTSLFHKLVCSLDDQDDCSFESIQLVDSIKSSVECIDGPVALAIARSLTTQHVDKVTRRLGRLECFHWQVLVPLQVEGCSLHALVNVIFSHQRLALSNQICRKTETIG